MNLVAFSPALALVLAIGCAVENRQATDEGVDPSIPGVDAGKSAQPAYGDDDDDADAGTTAKKDGGKTDGGTLAPPDAGPTYPRPAAGELLITEVMYNPFGSEPDAEWFEVLNQTTSIRSLSGLIISDGGGRTHTVAAGVVIQAGAYGLLARSKAAAVAAKVPDAKILYEYGTGLPSNAGILLLNGATGMVSLKDNGDLITASSYGPWYSQSGGSSVQLKVLDANAASDATKWCLSFNPWATGSDKGTPGAASDCP